MWHRPVYYVLGRRIDDIPLNNRKKTKIAEAIRPDVGTLEIIPYRIFTYQHLGSQAGIRKE